MTPDWTDDQPIYRQLKQKVMAAILDGSLPEGEALPSVRKMAVELQINPLTASRAYAELVTDGLVEKRRGLGMFVIKGARDQVTTSERTRFLQTQWPQIMTTIDRLGLRDQLLPKPAPKTKKGS